MHSIFFEGPDGKPIELPLPPDKITTKVGNKNKTIDLIATGEFNTLKDVGLREFSFKVLLPGQKYPFVQIKGAFHEPIFYLSKFREFKEKKQPVKFVVSRELPNGKNIFSGCILVSFEEYTVEENAGEEGDFWVDIRLKEYREILEERLIPVGVNPKTGATQVVREKIRPTKEIADEYVVKKNDTLWLIAKRECNDETLHKELARINNITDPRNLQVGQVLKLPKAKKEPEQIPKPDLNIPIPDLE